jgi:adenine-specific DNA methylase
MEKMPAPKPEIDPIAYLIVAAVLYGPFQIEDMKVKELREWAQKLADAIRERMGEN